MNKEHLASIEYKCNSTTGSGNQEIILDEKNGI